jgi:hypothetical protein
VAVSGTENTFTKFTSSTTIGDTQTPVVEISGSSRNTVVVGAITRTTIDALLEISSTNQGILFPRVSETVRTTVIGATSSNIGLIVYQTDGDEGLYIYKSGGWVQII